MITRGFGITIDVDNMRFETDGALIVCAPTGIFYTAQCGGIACAHPVAEGFCLPMFDILQVDQCDAGCTDIGYVPSITESFAAVLAERLPKETERYSFRLDFDYSRLSELKEGWWPVIVRGTMHDVSDLNHKAYLHLGNCD